MTMGIAKIIDRPAWRVLCAAAAASMLFGAAGLVFNVTWIPAWNGPRVRADAPPAQPEHAVQAVQRCPQCGWIESKRKVVPSAADPPSPGIYEYTLRMSDGSARVFREALPATWRVGERLTLIDGQDSAPE